MFYSSFEKKKRTNETNIEFLKDVYSPEISGCHLHVEVSTGPKENWSGFPDKGAFGEYCLEVKGVHKNCGRSVAHAVLYQGLNEKIEKGYEFSFDIFPEFVDEYDYQRTAEYIAVDLQFNDGSYLSELNLKDVNGHEFSIGGKALEKAIFMHQWNKIQVDLSSLEGKIVDKILVRYDKKSKSQHVGEVEYLAYIDEVYIGESKKIEGTPADYVITTRGTNDTLAFSRGLCIPATCVPNSFNFYVPSTTSGGRGLYDYHAEKITHFMVSHQASIHLFDYGCLMFMPNTGISEPTEENCKGENRASCFEHKDEIALPHYYSVKFGNQGQAAGVEAKIAPASHSCLVEFDYPENSENVNVIFDCVCEYTNFAKDESSISFNEDGTFTAISCFRSDLLSQGFKRMYFYGKFNEIPERNVNLSDERALSMVSFAKGTKKIIMQLASSYISFEQAKYNLDLEISETDTIDTVSTRAKELWNKHLGVIEVKDASEEEKISLYSNLYRMYMYPTTLSENKGTNEEPHWVYLSPYGTKKDEIKISEGMIYTTNGFWDTYRTAWPAYMLLNPQHAGELLDGVLEHYNECGWVGRWLCPDAIRCMVGTSADLVFADAYNKDIKFNKKAAYLASLKDSVVSSVDLTYGREFQNTSLFKGYTPNEICWSLEGYLTDNAVSIMAEQNGEKDEAAYLRNNSLKYRKVFSKKADFFIGRKLDGEFVVDENNFDPFEWGFGYTETNGWGTAFTAQHDVNGMIELYGGKDKFTKKVNEMFETETKFSATWRQHEMYEARELQMGQYQHSNQPAHHNIFMFSYTNTPYNTQKYTRLVLDRYFVGNKYGQGYVGDEDNGEQSAWYVLASMGFYSMNMGSGEYIITSPLFKEATIHRSTGDITIKAHNNSKENVYIKSISIDGKPYDKLFISHKELIEAKNIEFEMSSIPTEFGKGYTPKSISAPGEVLPLYEDISNKCEISCNDDVTNLFDDDMYTEFVGGKEVSIDFKLNEEKVIKFVTVSSSNDLTKTPKSVELLGSKDGKTYTSIDKRENQEWKWDYQLRPFLIEDEKEYAYYRVVLSGNQEIRIGELEILA